MPVPDSPIMTRGKPELSSRAQALEFRGETWIKRHVAAARPPLGLHIARRAGGRRKRLVHPHERSSRFEYVAVSEHASADPARRSRRFRSCSRGPHGPRRGDSDEARVGSRNRPPGNADVTDSQAALHAPRGAPLCAAADVDDVDCVKPVACAPGKSAVALEYDDKTGGADDAPLPPRGVRIVVRVHHACYVVQNERRVARQRSLR